jgi:hypothetical protein
VIAACQPKNVVISVLIVTRDEFPYMLQSDELCLSLVMLVRARLGGTAFPTNKIARKIPCSRTRFRGEKENC